MLRISRRDVGDFPLAPDETVEWCRQIVRKDVNVTKGGNWSGKPDANWNKCSGWTSPFRPMTLSCNRGRRQSIARQRLGSIRKRLSPCPADITRWTRMSVGLDRYAPSRASAAPLGCPMPRESGRTLNRQPIVRTARRLPGTSESQRRGENIGCRREWRRISPMIWKTRPRRSMAARKMLLWRAMAATSVGMVLPQLRAALMSLNRNVTVPVGNST
jgi:hypothetical protein